MVDTLASEYGWKAEYILDLPVDVTGELCHALLRRRGARVWRKQPQIIPEGARLSERLEGIFSAIDKEE